MNQSLVWVALLGLCFGAGSITGFFVGQKYGVTDDLLSPILGQNIVKDTHLNQYRITDLNQLNFKLSPIQLDQELKTTDKFTSFQFSYQTIGGTVTGLMNIPIVSADRHDLKVIILIRGYVPLEIYQPGVGTRAAGEALAENGYITLAPDFLGYGESDAEPSDVLEARFIKPAQIMNLIENIKQVGVPIPSGPDRLTDAVLTKSDQIGIWAHSNGGQIALTALEGLGQPIPTTLWAPVTAPFPYSILFFSDEDDDEGQAARANTALFEKNYDAQDFSLTKHLDRLAGPLQLHQGTSDEAVPVSWNREFKDKILAENKRRSEASSEQPSPAVTGSPLPTIALKYFEYPGADHNLKPGWDQAMARDLAFFQQNLK